jgi:hypothetical protein
LDIYQDYLTRHRVGLQREVDWDCAKFAAIPTAAAGGYYGIDAME